MPCYPVKRDGFEFTDGQFLACPGRIERVESADLRDMFLPRLTPRGNNKLKAPGFVAAQLRHYGVDYDEHELINGTELLKQSMRAGKLDKVPDRIEKLRSQMSAEWHDQLTLGELAAKTPEYLIKKHFADASGKPDRTKTTQVLIVPLSLHSTGCAEKLSNAAKNVSSGLHHMERKEGPQPAFYIGWDREAMIEAFDGHSGGEEDCSPIGRYRVECDSIDETNEGGVFEANFQFRRNRRNHDLEQSDEPIASVPHPIRVQ
ncbi:hypothetical protein F5B20DRAFT_320588 [Whalleya microplaca]|nr:hypothetical protein F5B20DRAFT_320588 [Whalleya microplaca]